MESCKSLLSTLTHARTWEGTLWIPKIIYDAFGANIDLTPHQNKVCFVFPFFHSADQ